KASASGSPWRAPTSATSVLRASTTSSSSRRGWASSAERSCVSTTGSCEERRCCSRRRSSSPASTSRRCVRSACPRPSAAAATPLPADSAGPRLTTRGDERHEAPLPLGRQALTEDAPHVLRPVELAEVHQDDALVAEVRAHLEQVVEVNVAATPRRVALL